MKTSRQKVLDYFYTHSIATAGDISQVLKMTPANARHHINILLTQGLLETAGERQQRGKGRPMQLFRLSQQALGDNFELLLHAALIILQEQNGEAGYRTSLEKIAVHLASLKHKTDPEKTTQPILLSQKLVNAIETLNQLNYQARWEAHRDGPRIILGRCPYQRILHQHPELCHMDRSLLENITSSSATHTARLARDTSGATYCLFQVFSKLAAQK
jgi:predicted ArsR family transcriptional regulator